MSPGLKGDTGGTYKLPTINQYAQHTYLDLFQAKTNYTYNCHDNRKTVIMRVCDGDMKTELMDRICWKAAQSQICWSDWSRCGVCASSQVWCRTRTKNTHNRRQEEQVQTQRIQCLLTFFRTWSGSTIRNQRKRGEQKMAECPKIELFLKASGDAESVGNCPFGQRLFMILWLKRANFTVTTVDMKRAPDVLKNLAPGSQPPFLLFNGELKTDTNKIEEFLEEALAPPLYPKLCCCHNSSKTAGEDIFRTFSAYIKIGKHGLYEQLEKKFLRSLTRLDQYLTSALDHDSNHPRTFLDGDTLTLADCNLLPKLHIVRVVCKKYRGLDFEDLKGISRYMAEADQKEEFKYTCPPDSEILHAYSSVATYWDK